MGDKAIAYFAEAERLGGIVCRMRLASMAQLTSIEAAAVPDTPEILERVEHAMTKLRVDFSRPASPPAAPATVASSSDQEGRFDSVPDAPRAGVRDLLRPGASRTSPSGTYPLAAPADPRVLRRQLGALVDVMSQRTALFANVAEAARRINEIMSSVLEAGRVGVWFFDDARNKLLAVDVFDRRTMKHVNAPEFAIREHPAFLRALERERTVAAHHAHADGRTSSLARPWLEPNGVSSLLAAPIWADGRLIGVLVIEQLGQPHTWSPDEENVAFLLASMLGITSEQASRPRPRA